jgi:hypothetical protein
MFYIDPCRGVTRKTTGTIINAFGREPPFREELSTEAEE